MVVVRLGACWGCVFRGAGAVSGEAVVYLGGARGWSWAPVPRQVMGLRREGRCPSEEVKGRVQAFAQGPTWGLPARTPLLGVPAHPQTPRPGVETGSPSGSSCAQAGGAEPPPRSLGGGSGSQPTHLPSDGGGRSLHKGAWRASLCLKRHGLGGGGNCTANGPHGGSFENH